MEAVTLTLAFVGNQEIHRNNSLALLRDLVGGFLKQHRKADVKIILPEPGEDEPSDTLADIEDWASTSGYELTQESAGNMVTLLLMEDNTELILVGDPSEDYVVYAVAEEAAKFRIVTRSLLNGLEKVVFEDDLDENELAEGFHEVDLDDSDDLDDDVLSEPDGLEPDLDVLAVLADDGEVDAQTELMNIADALDIDAAAMDTWADVVAAVRGSAEDAVEVDPDYVPDPPDETVQAPLPEPEEEYFDPEKEENLTPIREYTREWLEAQTFEKVRDIGLECGIPKGRGMKHGVFVNKILVATGAETTADQAKRKKPKKAPKVTDLAPVVETPLLIEVPPEATITPIRADEANNVRLALVAELRGIADRLELL